MIMIVILLQVQVFLSKKSLLREQILSPLESGFERLYSSTSVRTPFFFLAILFVLFDLELILFFPGIIIFLVSLGSFNIWLLINFTIFFTLVIEWSFCGLKWQI